MAAIFKNGIQYSGGAAVDFDTTPTANSNKPITSGGVYASQHVMTSVINNNTLRIEGLESGQAVLTSVMATKQDIIEVTANRAMISDASGHPAASDITSTELSYLDDARGNVQGQIDDISDNIAPTESGSTASQAYTEGSYIIWNNRNLYQVTTAVTQGTTWAVGTNLSAVTIGGELDSLNGRITYGTSAMTPGTTPLADGNLYFQYE